MKDQELLPNELLWADDGHASDVVLTALADGQRAIVPPDAAMAHVERCAACMMHLGNSALLSLETRRLLVPARRPVPRAAVLLGLVTAALGLVPWLVAAPNPARSVSTFTREIAALTTHLGPVRSSTLGVVATYVAAIGLVFIGLLFARLSPKKEVSS